MPLYRELYSGIPIWRGANGRPQHEHPNGHKREVDPDTGAFYSVNEAGPLLDEYGETIWDTMGFWGG